jgi:hypothetical protein
MQATICVGLWHEKRPHLGSEDLIHHSIGGCAGMNPAPTVQVVRDEHRSGGVIEHP